MVLKYSPSYYFYFSQISTFFPMLCCFHVNVHGLSNYAYFVVYRQLLPIALVIVFVFILLLECIARWVLVIIFWRYRILPSSYQAYLTMTQYLFLNASYYQLAIFALFTLFTIIPHAKSTYLYKYPQLFLLFLQNFLIFSMLFHNIMMPIICLQQQMGEYIDDCHRFAI